MIDDGHNDDDVDPELFSLHPFVLNCQVFASNHLFNLQCLLDTGCTAYTLIHEKLIPTICESLGIEPIQLSKPKRVRGFDGKIAKKHITHAIYPGLIIQKHRELSVPMLIADLGQHDVILGKPWMNRHRLQLDLSNDSILFPEPSSPPRSKSPSSSEASLPHASTKQMGSFPPRVPKVLARPKPEKADAPFSIHSIGAAPFGCLARRYDTQIFALSMADIDSQLALDRECRMEEISLSTVEAASQNLEELRQKIPPEYHEYLEVFDRSQANRLPPHRSCDHKIELTSDSIPPQSRAYRMSPFKLQKVKEYLNENLSKGFITPSKAPYSSPVLFALKANGDLRFCVDYRKLNAMTKRNRYPLPLIEEVIGKIMGCKHLTRLDIIAAFNKLRMHPDSEDMTTFITALGAYKYRVLPFGLTNGPSTFQQYINDTLWDFLNDFCQAYLDDILIYSRTKKEHQKHVS